MVGVGLEQSHPLVDVVLSSASSSIFVVGAKALLVLMLFRIHS